jgi:hypothetical protein
MKYDADSHQVIEDPSAPRFHEGDHGRQGSGRHRTERHGAGRERPHERHVPREHTKPSPKDRVDDWLSQVQDAKSAVDPSEYSFGEGLQDTQEYEGNTTQTEETIEPPQGVYDKVQLGSKTYWMYRMQDVENDCIRDYIMADRGWYEARCTYPSRNESYIRRDPDAELTLDTASSFIPHIFGIPTKTFFEKKIQSYSQPAAAGMHNTDPYQSNSTVPTAPWPTGSSVPREQTIVNIDAAPTFPESEIVVTNLPSDTQGSSYHAQRRGKGSGGQRGSRAKQTKQKGSLFNRFVYGPSRS